MTDTLSLDDVQNEAAQRDENGDLVAETKEIPWKGDTKEVKVYPTTVGHANKYASIEEAITQLDPEAIADVLQGQYAEPDFASQPKGDLVAWLTDLPMQRLKELLAPSGLADEEAAEGNLSANERRKQRRRGR